MEIQNVNNSNGEFSLLIRRGNDNSKNKNILKTFQNVSLDPNKSNYISKVIGDSYSEVKNDGTDYFVKTYGEYPNTQPYVYVAEVNNPTLDYSDVNGEVNTDNNGISFSGSLPLVSSGSFENGTGDLHPTELGASKFNENISSTNIQGVNPEAYIESFNLLTNTDDYRFNILTAPGLNNEDHGTEVEKLASVATERQDCISVIDLVGYDTPLSTVTTQASNFNNSYAATYWPWLQTQMDGKNAWVPPSTLIPGVYAFTDRSSAAWFAPAGLTRGAINANKAERKLTAGNRDTLYAANVNPIATFPGSGVVVFGQKTLQKGASALDRVNVRRLLIELKSYISQISDNLVFEQNSIATRNSFLTQVNPYLEGIQQRQGLYAFKVVMDETNNTADVVDRNELVGQIYLQPTKTAEFILLDFNVTPTGASFPA